MSVDIPSDLQPFVDQQVKLGCYASEQQVVAAAIRLLQADREEAVAGIQAGLADAAAGKMQPLDEAMDDLRRELGLHKPA
jgi:putative addiction module CopG family antidote